MEILILILAFSIGITLGILTGLTPGIHINLVTGIIVLSPLISIIEPTAFIIFIVSMAITHTLVDFIPSIFLGAPDEDTALSVLPGHEFLLKGYGHHAIRLTLIGSVISIVLLIMILPIFIFIIPKIYPFIQRMMGLFLIWIVIIMILGEKEGKMRCLILFLLAGFLGISTLNLNLNQPLLPMLTGLFGASTLLTSIKTNTKIPKQDTGKIKITREEIIKPTIISSIISPLASIFPGIGSSEASVIGSKVAGNLNREQFLVLLGSINTFVLALSFIALFTIQKVRTGAAATINQITSIGTKEVLVIILVIIATTLIAYPLTLKISKLFAGNISKINYTKLSTSILLLISVLVLIISGFLGFFVFIVSTILGLTAIELNVRRSFLMGCLLIPTILFYLPF